METMKTASVNGCYSSIMLKVTVMALAAAFYGKKGSALQTHFKDLFQKISPRRPSIPCTKPVEADFCVQPKEIHPSHSCKSWRSRRQVCFPSSNALNSPVSALPAWVERKAPLDFCWPVQLLTADGSGPCHIYSLAKFDRIHVPFHKNKDRGSWFSAASGNCDSIREWCLACSTKQWFPDAGGNQTLLYFE